VSSGHGLACIQAGRDRLLIMRDTVYSHDFQHTAPPASGDLMIV
jgi:hypothetical protein